MDCICASYHTLSLLEVQYFLQAATEPFDCYRGAFKQNLN